NTIAQTYSGETFTPAVEKDYFFGVLFHQ
ncbi:imidazole glycerol phosphate synthase subunit HisH, partial [Yersinia pestis]|nr:imidazole glycerol phosphate synthase subunit HisH [Yersinia pestis]